MRRAGDVRIYTGEICIPEMSNLFNQAADTIEALSAKLQAENVERSSVYYNSCENCQGWNSIHGGCLIHNTVPGGCKDFRLLQKPNNSDTETAREKHTSHCCGTCYWYNGEIEDGNQFCDELEVDVNGKFYCNKWRGKY